MKRQVFISAVMIATAWSAAPAEGPEVGLVYGSFSPHVRPGRWGQVTAKLANPTDRAVRVRFVYPTEEADRGRVRYTRTVRMPPRTRRTIRLGRYAPETPTKRTSAAGRRKRHAEQTFDLEDASTGRILHRNYMLISELSPVQVALGYIDTEDAPGQDHSYLSKMPDSPLGKVVLTNSVARRLPDRWYGYSALQIFVISAAEPSQLLDSQIEAVLDWVGSGGVLVLAAHSDARRTISGRFAEAAGVAVAGTHEEYRIEASETPGKARFRIDLKTPMVMAQLCPLDADVLWEANGLPLLTLRRRGAGGVFTLAVPVGTLSAEQAHHVWQTVAGHMRRVPPITGEGFAEAAQEKLPRIAGRQGPDRRAPAYIVGAQVVLFALLGIALRFLRRGEIAWLALVPAGLLASVGLTAYGMTARDEPRVSFLALACARDGGAHVRQLSTYYTPQTEQVAFSSGSLLGTVRGVGGLTAAGMESSQVSGDRIMRLPGVTVIRNSSRTAYAEAPVRMPRLLSAEVRLGPRGLEGTITNSSGEDFFDAVIIAGGVAYAVGDLPAGKTSSITAGDPPLPRDAYTGRDVRDKIDRLRSELTAAIAYRPVSRRRYLPGPTLLAWSGCRLLDPLPETDAVSNGLTLLTMPLTLGRTPAGTRIVVPGGLLKLDIGGHPPVWNAKKRQFIKMGLPGVVVLDFAPLESVGDLTGARAVLRIALHAANYRMRVFGFTGRDGDPPKQTLAKTVNRPAGAYEVAVDGLRRLPGRQGRFRIVVKIDSLGGGGEKRTIWKIESINLTLEGTCK